MLNFAVLFSLPIFAVPALLFGPPIASLLLRAAIAGIIGFVAMAIVSGVFLVWDRPLDASSAERSTPSPARSVVSTRRLPPGRPD